MVWKNNKIGNVNSFGTVQDDSEINASDAGLVAIRTG